MEGFKCYVDRHYHDYVFIDIWAKVLALLFCIWYES